MVFISVFIAKKVWLSEVKRLPGYVKLKISGDITHAMSVYEGKYRILSTKGHRLKVETKFNQDIWKEQYIELELHDVSS